MQIKSITHWARHEASSASATHIVLVGSWRPARGSSLLSYAKRIKPVEPRSPWLPESCNNYDFPEITGTVTLRFGHFCRSSAKRINPVEPRSPWLPEICSDYHFPEITETVTPRFGHFFRRGYALRMNRNVAVHWFVPTVNPQMTPQARAILRLRDAVEWGKTFITPRVQDNSECVKDHSLRPRDPLTRATGHR